MLIYIIIQFFRIVYGWANRNGYVKIIGDIAYAMGIGISGTGLYNLMTHQPYTPEVIALGIFGIIFGSILKR